MLDHQWGAPKASPDGTIYDVLAVDISMEYGLEPFVAAKGHLGIHFMNISYSLDYERTIETDLAKSIEGGIEKETINEYFEYRDMLIRMVGIIDAAIADYTETS